MTRISAIGLVFALGLMVSPGCGGDDDGVRGFPTPTGMDECINPADLAIVRLTPSGDGGVEYGNDAGIVSIGDYYADCAVGDCFAPVVQEDFDAIDPCMVTCLASTPAGGLSDSCRNCYNWLVTCVATQCANFCIVDPLSTGCQDCISRTCAPAGRECSGITLL